MNENKIVMMLDYEDGTKGKRELLSIFPANNGNEYAALLPLNDDETPMLNANVELIRAVPFINEDNETDYKLEAISSEGEFAAAQEAFSKISEGSEPEELDDLPTLTFPNENGEDEEWQIADIFEHRNRKYVALIPKSSIVEDNAEIHLMRFTLKEQDGVEGYEVSSIPSDMEFEDVSKVFEARILSND